MGCSDFDGSWQLACQTIRGKGFLGTSLDIQGTEVDFEIDGTRDNFPVEGLLPDGLSVNGQTKGSFIYDAEMHCVTILGDELLVGSVRRRPSAPTGEDDDTDVFVATRKPTGPPDDD